MMRAFRWLVGALTDPISKDASSARIAGLLCVSTACFVAVYGVVTNVEHDGVVTALAVGAGAALLLRKRAEPDA